MSEDPHSRDEQPAETNTENQPGGALTGEPQIEIEWCPEHGPRRRLRFIPRADDSAWVRIEAEWTRCRWRQVGQATATNLSVRMGNVEYKPDLSRFGPE